MTTINTLIGFASIVNTVSKNGWEVSRKSEIAPAGGTVGHTDTITAWDTIDGAREVVRGDHRIITEIEAWHSVHTDGARRLTLRVTTRAYTNQNANGTTAIPYVLIDDMREELIGMINAIMHDIADEVNVRTCDINSERRGNDQLYTYSIPVCNEQAWQIREELSFENIPEEV